MCVCKCAGVVSLLERERLLVCRRMGLYVCV